ncbi:hypothetical protein BJ165DRAFT_930631 [Panaeolus papilionaceus]|nr:hypothetical protein BJ165DRAFT_930631 [Panaeolus papilionaceus]
MASTLTTDHECAFPLEIFGLIIDNLTADERSEYLPTLRACCLVCKSFMSLCRPVMFQSITYGPFGKPSIARKHFGELFTTEPRLGTYVKRVHYVLQTDDDPPPDEESVRAAASELYEAGSSVGEEGKIDLTLPVDTIVSCILYRQYIALGGRMDGFQASLGQYLPKVEALSITHHFCHDTRADSPYPCDNRYCYEFGLLVLEEFGDRKLISLSINGLANLPAWHALNFPTLEDLELVHCFLEDWNRPADAEHSDEEDDTDDKEVGSQDDETGRGHADVVNGEELDSDSDWETVGSDDKRGRNPSALPNIKHLTINDVSEFSFNIIQHLPFLETINMKAVEDFTSDLLVDDSKAHTTLPYLHTLVTDQLFPWDDICEAAEEGVEIAFPALRVLDAVLNNDDDIDTMNNIFDHVEVLESLTLTAGEDTAYDLPLEMPGLWNCFTRCKTTLKHIDLRWNQRGYDFDDTVIAAICDNLEDVEGDNVIESIKVEIDMGSVHSAASSPRPSFEEWRRLDTLLTQSRAFPSLREVSLKLLLIPPIFRASPNSWILTQFLRQPMKKLRRASDISFSCCVEHIDH